VSESSEPRTLVMWAASSPTGLVRVVVCPACRALVLADDYAEHERFHAA
jgi:hypothetical protein